MPLYAVEDLDDALDATRALLAPFDAGRWLRLALVALFVGGVGGNVPTVSYSAGGDGGQPVLPGEVVVPEVPDAVLGVAVAVAVFLALLGLAFAAVGAIMEFVLVESLREEVVAVRRYWNRRWRQGLRLLAFRIGLAVLTAVVLAALAAAVLLPAMGGAGGVAVVALLVAVPVGLLVLVVAGLVNGFTTVFVVPSMVKHGGGVLAGWRRVWPTIRAQPRQFLAYAVLGFVLGAAGGVAVGVVMGIVALLLVVPFGLLAALGVGLLGVAAPVGVVVIAVSAVLFVLALLVAAAVVRVPVLVYLRYYALLVLGDADPDLDLVAERRAAIRSEESPE